MTTAAPSSRRSNRTPGQVASSLATSSTSAEASLTRQPYYEASLRPSERLGRPIRCLAGTQTQDGLPPVILRYDPSRMSPERSDVEALDEAVDHVRGPANAPVILEYGDFECPYSRRAYREIQRVERARGGDLRFAFRHFPLTGIHPHALAAARAAEAAARQERYWEMHEMLFHRQRALDDPDLREYASELGLHLESFDADFAGPEVLERIQRDVHSAVASGNVRGTPTLFIEGMLHRGDYNAATLLSVIGG
jgi:protein-disulfide isomerase